MAQSSASRKWDAENALIFSVKFFKTSEADIIAFMDSKVDKASGIGRGTILKRALAMYMESEIAAGRYAKPSEKREFCYGMRLRGYSPGAQPKGVTRREDDTTGKYHDIIVYDRRLSADEIRDYELEEIK